MIKEDQESISSIEVKTVISFFKINMTYDILLIKLRFVDTGI